LRRFRGSGCHPSRAVALVRALTEAAQVRLTYIAGNRDDLVASEYRESQDQRLGGALLDAVSAAAPGRAFRDVPNFDTDELALDVQWELERLAAAGLHQVIAIDLTRADFAIPVTRVVIPGLEWDCTHPHYVPGRRARAMGAAAQ
jgi:ribosomal protein S12 methylthiotransferase accessory factor